MCNFLKPRLKDFMIGKVFKLEYRKDCGELLQFLCICQIWYQNTGDSFNSPSQGFWYHHLSQFKFMRMSSCNKQYKNALSFCIFFPQYILKWLKKKQYSLGLGFFFDGENERKKQKMTLQSQSTDQALAHSETSGLIHQSAP